MMSTPPPLLLYIYYFLVVVLFFYLVKRLGKKSTHNYDTTTTATKNPIQLRSSNRLIYEFFFWRKSALTRTKPFTPSLSTLSRSIYKATSTYNIPPNIISDSFLFVCERLTIYKVVRTQNLLYIYLQWWTKVWYVLYYYYYLCYILLLFFVFLPKSYCFLWLSSSTLICSKHTTTN